MPLFYQHNINQETKLGIWFIEEPESFFLEKVPLKRDVSHPFKRRQHFAGRYLLSFLFPDFPLQEIRIADTRQPFLASEKYHCSISHCGNYAAAIVSTNSRVGVDIELIMPRIETLAREVGTSARTLSRLFASETQLSFKSWCQRARIAAAIERLSTDTNVSIKQVAGELGYASLPAFSHAFRQVTGRTPTEFIQKA